MRQALFRSTLILIATTALALIVNRTPQATWAQEDPGDLVGVYRTEPLENEVTGETIIRQITLFDDTSAESITSFTKAGNNSYEVGGWYPTPDDTVVVFFVRRYEDRGGRQSAIKPPLQIEFEADGATLFAPDVLGYGPRDLLLERVDDEPASFRDENDQLLEELRVGLAEFPDTLFLGEYLAEDIDVEGKTVWLALSLAEDGEATLEYPPGEVGDDAVESRARWQNYGDGTIGIEVLADLDADGEVLVEYDPPQRFSVFDRLETGGLVSHEILLEDGSQLILSRVETEPVAADAITGVYAGAGLHEVDGATGVLMLLREDGSVAATLVEFDSEGPPLVVNGSWSLADTTLTMTMTHQLEFDGDESQRTELDNSIPVTFTVEEDLLVSEELTLQRMPLQSMGGSTGETEPGDSAAAQPTASSTPEPTEVPAETMTYLVGREQLRAGVAVMLLLRGDGSAVLSTQLGPDEATILEMGTWSEDGDEVIVTLDHGIDNQLYDEAHVLHFERTDERTLTATDYDAERYSEDLVLYNTLDY